MTSYGKILGSIDADQNMAIYYALIKMYEAMSGNEHRIGTDALEYATYVRNNLSKWIELLEREIFINTDGNLVYSAEIN